MVRLRGCPCQAPVANGVSSKSKPCSMSMDNRVGRLDVDPEFFAEFSLCCEIRCLFGFDMATDDVPDTRVPGPVRGASADQNHA